MYKLIPFNNISKSINYAFKSINIDSKSMLQIIRQEAHVVTPPSKTYNTRPWSMHTNQIDKLIILHGSREVELYCRKSKLKEKLTLTTFGVFKNGYMEKENPCMLIIPNGTYHRFINGPYGSTVINIVKKI